MPDPNPDFVETAPAAIRNRSEFDVSRSENCVSRQLNPRVENTITIGFAALILYTTVRDIARASARPFWFDEVLTAILTRQRGLSSLWRALAHAADTNPPAYYLLEKVFTRFISSEQVALRMPSILGFSCLLWCLFVFVKRRDGALIAAVVGMLPLITVVYETYAVEARPYCLPLACIAIAAVCYQRAPDRIWMIGLALSLVAAQSFHYYSILAITPFLAAEAILLAKTKWVRLSVWVALLCGSAPLVAFWPLVSRVKAYYGPTNWAPATLSGTIGMYNWLFHLPDPFDTFNPVIIVGSISLLFLTAIGAACATSLLAYRSIRAKPECTPFFHEQMLAACFLALPLITFVATKITHGGDTGRYALATAIGASVAASYALRRVRPKICILVGIAMLAAIGARELTFWLAYDGTLNVSSDFSHVEKWTSVKDVPIVISSSLDYLPYAYYGSPQWDNRFTALIDLRESMAYMGSDSFDRQLLALRPLVPIHVYEFGVFRKEHPVFLLCSTSTGEDFRDWWPVFLIREGYSLKRVAVSGQISMFLVTQENAAAALAATKNH